MERIIYASANPAVLQSPNYPQYYDNNLKHKWTIVPPESNSVKITFDYIKIEEKYDSLKFCTGDGCSPADLFGGECCDTYSTDYNYVHEIYNAQL